MSEELDKATIDFANEVAPQSRPRDQAGRFVEARAQPEGLFSERQVEGDPLTGDTSDGGDDPRFAEAARKPPARRQPVVDDEGIPFGDEEPEQIGGEIEESDEGEAEAGDDGDQRFEVTVDGRKQEVTLEEALAGYIRTATFHQRSAQLNDLQQQLDAEAGRIQHNWGLWHKARLDYEEDLANLLPREPDWDREFALDPAEAHRTQKTFQIIYNKLAQSRQARAEREFLDQQDKDRRLQKYAVDGFARFVFDNKIPDEQTLKRELQSMRRTASAAGFSEYEVATVYDPRMLTILRKASKYDRMMAVKPRAVIPGKGKTLTPGAATPFGNARRSGFNDAQRRLAQSGKLSDAADVFREIL